MGIIGLIFGMSFITMGFLSLFDSDTSKKAIVMSFLIGFFGIAMIVYDFTSPYHMVKINTVISNNLSLDKKGVIIEFNSPKKITFYASEPDRAYTVAKKYLIKKYVIEDYNE